MTKSDQKILAFIAFSIIWCWLWYEAYKFFIKTKTEFTGTITAGLSADLIAEIKSVDQSFDFTTPKDRFKFTPFPYHLIFRKPLGDDL